MLKVIEWNFRFFVGNIRLEIADDDDDDDLPIISVLLSFGNRKTCTVTWLINECFGKSFFFFRQNDTSFHNFFKKIKIKI